MKRFLILASAGFLVLTGMIGCATRQFFPGTEETSQGPEQSQFIFQQEEKVILDAYDGKIKLTADITDDLATQVIDTLEAWQADTAIEEIQIFIYSPGGSPAAALAICDVIKDYPKPVSTISLGQAYSGAAFILSSGDKGKRFATRHSLIMLHRPMTIIQAMMRREHLELQAEKLAKIERQIFDLLAENTGKNVRQIEKDLAQERWLTAEEAIEYGLIDGIWHGE